MKKQKIITTLQKALGELGITPAKNDGFYTIEYEHLDILLVTNDKDNSFSLICPIFDVNEGPQKASLDIALDVVANFHKGYSGDWNDGSPYFSSPTYSINTDTEVTGEWMKKTLKDFWDAFMFLESNLYIMGDDSMMQLINPN